MPTRSPSRSYKVRGARSRLETSLASLAWVAHRSNPEYLAPSNYPSGHALGLVCVPERIPDAPQSLRCPDNVPGTDEYHVPEKRFYSAVSACGTHVAWVHMDHPHASLADHEPISRLDTCIPTAWAISRNRVPTHLSTGLARYADVDNVLFPGLPPEHLLVMVNPHCIVLTPTPLPTVMFHTIALNTVRNGMKYSLLRRRTVLRTVLSCFKYGTVHHVYHPITTTIGTLL